jgi:hypothetical protein
MQNRWMLPGKQDPIATFILASSSVMISLGTFPPIAERKVLNNHSYDSIFSLTMKALPKKHFAYDG